MNKTIFVESGTNSYQISLAKPRDYESGYITQPTLLFEREVKTSDEDEKLTGESKLIIEKCRIELTESQYKKLYKYFDEVELDE